MSILKRKLGRKPGPTEETLELREKVVRLRDVERLTFEEIGDRVGLFRQHAHIIYNLKVVKGNLQT